MHSVRRFVAILLLLITSGALGVTWWMARSMQNAEGDQSTPAKAKLLATADALQTYLIPVFGALTLLAVFYAFVTFLRERTEE